MPEIKTDIYNSIHKLRRAVGKLKWKTMCWPYKFKQRQAAKLREQLRSKAFELPRIPPATHPEVEIHMLCGKKQIDMGGWASWSILRFLRDAVLYVHSDGTLNSEEIIPWQKVVPGMVFISKAEADSCVSEKIASRAPHLYNWRCNYWAGSQVVDVHFFGNTDQLIIMDTDVLCFHDPIELRRALSTPDATYRWNKGIRTSYSADTKLLNQITGLSLPERFNCGFSTVPRWHTEEFDYLEKVLKLLKVDGRVDTENLWSGQTYYAMCAARCPKSQALPDNYAVTTGRTSHDMIVRHYIGIPQVRPRYFIEGIPEVLNSKPADL